MQACANAEFAELIFPAGIGKRGLNNFHVLTNGVFAVLYEIVAAKPTREVTSHTIARLLVRVVLDPGIIHCFVSFCVLRLFSSEKIT